MCFDAIKLGAHFVGIAALMKSKLSPVAARKMVLEGHAFSATDALADGLIDELVESESLQGASEALASRVAVFGKFGTYGLMRRELHGDVTPKIMSCCM